MKLKAVSQQSAEQQNVKTRETKKARFQTTPAHNMLVRVYQCWSEQHECSSLQRMGTSSQQSGEVRAKPKIK
jgi:hypothetical protein